jgi:hypothetical protein
MTCDVTSLCETASKGKSAQQQEPGTSEREDTMKQFILGILFGSLVTGTVVGAGSLYDSKGNVAAPRGSQQQFDYFRQRQQRLDIEHMRDQMDKQQLDRKLGRNPC